MNYHWIPEIDLYQIKVNKKGYNNIPSMNLNKKVVKRKNNSNSEGKMRKNKLHIKCIEENVNTFHKEGNILDDLINNKYLKPILESQDIDEKLLNCNLKEPLKNSFNVSLNDFFNRRQKYYINYKTPKLDKNQIRGLSIKTHNISNNYDYYNKNNIYISKVYNKTMENNNINNYYNNIYKKQALFRNEHQNIKLKKEQICKNNNKIFDLKDDNNDNNPITEVKNSINKNIINNAENRVSDFTLREKLSYSEQHKIRKHHYLEKNLNNSMNNIHISNPSLKDINNNNNSSFQYKSNSGQKLNLSYLAFIKDFKAKYNEDTNLKNKKKRTYVPYLSKFLNTNIPPTLQICNEMIISIISSLEQKEIIDNNKNKNKNDDEIINIKNELNIKDNKIKELSEKIEVQNNEYIQLNNKYNDMISENQKLKEEISNLRKELNNNKIEIPNIDNIDDINKNNIITKESPKYNNLITYNINKNNNFNIINSEINNFNNIIQANDNNNDIQQQKEEEKEKDQSKKEKNNKEDKKSRALERLKKKHNKKEPEVKKSNKIAEMAKMLEMQMKGDNNENEEKEEVIENDGNNNNIVDLINSQIIINKKKKKGKKILFEE